MKMVKDEIRKGPWTEHEDILLVNFVHLFGDRRWDFIAKVSGLKVWRETNDRWSKIARKLPGRTDNEIKNYWRTHMRKKAQEKKRAMSPSSSSSVCHPSPSTSTKVDSLPFSGTGKVSFYDTGGPDMASLAGKKSPEFEDEKGYPMDEIWKDFDLYEENTMISLSDNYSEGCNFSCPSMASPPWEYLWDSLWKMDEEESKMFLPTNQFLSCTEYGKASLTG
ncbi:transcription factor MYB59-like isoform X2 [Durio zibethinus]|uniref:Transcription factor MYB59-like isoform X2 n=1 Tax=Durio zibethinus TaxID=66656 RepID=A0A6P5ZNC8_DURZI|nr:transcription factor MYB59-like isoform X2 [Durio zibethinus]